MKLVRSLALATALFAAGITAALAESTMDRIAAPVLRANVTVANDVVRIGDLIDNAGESALIAIYRAPDLGTTGSITTEQVLNTLRAHKVIGIDTKGIREISVTRLARTLERKDIELQVAAALERRNGLGDAANLTLTFDRGVDTLQLDTSNNGPMKVLAARYDQRSTRFDVVFGIGNEAGSAPVQLRFTGTAIETVEAAILTRSIDRNEIIKASDLVVERRPKSEIGNDAANRDRAVGMQARRPLREGQGVRIIDLAKPDLVQRDQGVTIVYEAAGLYITARGKALDSGTEGDVVNVLNLQSKRTISGTVVGRGQVSVVVATPRLNLSAAAPAETATPVAVAASDHASVFQKAE